MATIDKLNKNKDIEQSILLLKRFLDDFFLIFQGSTKELHALFAKINQIHPTIKLTMKHTSIKDEPKEERCDCEETNSIPFLAALSSSRSVNVGPSVGPSVGPRPL